MSQIILVGNPNCGKTTLFNALTGEHQRIGNWSGVTVEQKTGWFSIESTSTPPQRLDYSLIDLPGIYSLSCQKNAVSQDELITARAVVELDADLIINVIDACNLERHLYLTSQLVELGKPMIVVLNMMDIAKSRGITIDCAQLSQQLSCPVVPIQAHKKIGLEILKQTLKDGTSPSSAFDLNLDSSIKLTLQRLRQFLQTHLLVTEPLVDYYSLRILEGDTVLLTPPVLETVHRQEVFAPDLDLLFADARYEKIHQLVQRVQAKQSDASEYFTARVDKVVLHRYIAFPIFLIIMYLMFLFAINVGGIFQDFFDLASNAIFVQGSAAILENIHAPHWLIAIIAHGVGQGINTTVTFIPVIAAMFFFLSLLEASGYMARAAFVVDKIMRWLGLPGKSFVPMIVGFGCNVPAIMSARTLDSDRDRILTVLMSPFMSCSARLAIYAVFVAAFFPSGGQNIVFALYVIGILMAVFTGFILRKTLLGGQSSSLILELPAYHKPSLRRLCRETRIRLKYFITRAGRMIIPVCVVLGGLNALTIGGGVNATDASAQSVLSLVGQWLTPLFAPMGITPDNWPSTVGLLTGMLAKEVVIGTLNSLYSQVGQVQDVMSSFDLVVALKQALWSIPQNLIHLQEALWNPILASAPDNDISKSMYGVMVARFDGKVGAFAYLLFILLYIPCVSTMAAIRQETSKKMMNFSVIWSLLIAYVVAVVFYQSATLMQHPYQSIAWVIGLLASIGFFVAWLRISRGDYVTANS